MGKYREDIGDQNMNEKIANRSSASMKIVAGLGSIDEYERFIQAGAVNFLQAMSRMTGAGHMVR